MSLHDTEVSRYMAFGIAGLSVVADSLSAIKHARVGVVRDESGLITEFYSNRDFPAFGNDDDRADSIAVELVQSFLQKLQKHATYRDAEPTLSVLTITSNVVCGKKTGAPRTGACRASPSPRGRIRCTTATRRVPWLPSTRWQRSPTPAAAMGSPARSPCRPTRWGPQARRA